MLLNILLWTGLILYTVNYIIGWLLHFKKISMSRRTHQVFFVSIIVNLAALLFCFSFPSFGFFTCTASLAAMCLLPLGRKGGIYHRALSTAGFVLYLTLIY